MTIKEYNKNIEFLLPKKLSDFVTEGENCLLVEKIVEGLKNDPIYKKSFRDYHKKTFVICRSENLFFGNAFNCGFSWSLSMVFSKQEN